MADDPSKLLGDAFKVFMVEAPEYAEAWIGLARTLGDISALDAKTRELAYLAVLGATGNLAAIPFHVVAAKGAGATREEVLSTVMLGLTAVGGQAIQALPVALKTYDE